MSGRRHRDADERRHGHGALRRERPTRRSPPRPAPASRPSRPTSGSTPSKAGTPGFVDTTPRWFWCGAAARASGPVLGLLRGTTRPGPRSGHLRQRRRLPRSAQYGILAMQDVEVTIDDPVPAERRDHRRVGGGAGLAPRGSGRAVLGVGCDRHKFRRGRSCRRGDQRHCERQLRLTLDAPVCDVAGTLPSSRRLRRRRPAPRRRQAPTAAGNSRRRPATSGPTTRPGQALDVRLDGGDDWRARNSFTLGWRNPPADGRPYRRRALRAVSRIERRRRVPRLRRGNRARTRRVRGPRRPCSATGGVAAQPLAGG